VIKLGNQIRLTDAEKAQFLAQTGLATVPRTIAEHDQALQNVADQYVALAQAEQFREDAAAWLLLSKMAEGSRSDAVNPTAGMSNGQRDEYWRQVDAVSRPNDLLASKPAREE